MRKLSKKDDRCAAPTIDNEAGGDALPLCQTCARYLQLAKDREYQKAHPSKTFPVIFPPKFKSGTCYLYIAGDK